MARKVLAAMLTVIVTMFGGCAGYDHNKTASIWRPPPIDGLEWGMSEAEALTVLGLSEDEITKQPTDTNIDAAGADLETNGERYHSLTVQLTVHPQIKVYGVPGKAQLFFSSTDYGVDGLAGVSAIFEPESLVMLKEYIDAVWGDNEVDEFTVDYMRTTWKDIRNGEMDEELQAAVRALYDSIAPGYSVSATPGDMSSAGGHWSELPLSTCSLYEYTDPAIGPKLVVNGRHALIALCALRLSTN